MLVVDSTRADGAIPFSFIVGTLDRTGSPTAYVGLIRSSSPPAGEAGESILGNLNSASGSGVDVGDARGSPVLGVSGAVAVPGSRPLMVLSGGYDA